MRSLCLLSVALLLVPSVAAEFGAERNGWPVGVDGTSHDPAETMHPEALAALQDRARADMILAGDPLNRVGGNTVYPYYPILVAELQRLAADHPDKLRLTSAGKSTAGLDLYMLEIADFDAVEAGEGVPLEEREVVWVDGGTHSNEYSGVYFVLAVAQFLLDGYDTNDTARFIVDNRHTWIMPMVNPDGSHLMGRLNANLVNINRNYPVIWGGDGTDMALNNPGPEPASEIETQVNIDWFNRTVPDYYASVHCCGNLWLFPYGEDQYDPPDVDMMNRVCDLAFPDVREACGPIWSTIYPASGSSVDTAYEYTGAVAFGYEMSGRSNLAGPWGEPVTPEEVRDQERESWDGLFHAFLNVERYGALPVVEHVSAVAGGLAVEVRNDGYGNLTDATVRLDGHQVALPHLEPGATTTVTLPAVDEGRHELAVEYQKRIMADVRRTTAVDLAVGLDADEVVALGLDPESVLSVADASGPGADASVPAPAAALVLLGALAVAARRRR